MKFLLDHLGWLVVCALILIHSVFPAFGGPRVSALRRVRGDARREQP